MNGILQIYVVYNNGAPYIIVWFEQPQDNGSLYIQASFEELGAYIRRFQQQQLDRGKFVRFDKGVYVYNNRPFDAITINQSDTPEVIVTNFSLLNASTNDVVINAISGINVVYTNGFGYDAYPLLQGEAIKGLIQNPASGTLTLTLNISSGAPIDIAVFCLGTGKIATVTSLPGGIHDYVIPYSVSQGDSLAVVVCSPSPGGTSTPFGLITVTNDPSTGTGNITSVKYNGSDLDLFSGNALPLAPGQSGVFQIANTVDSPATLRIGTSGVAGTCVIDTTDSGGNFVSQFVVNPNDFGGFIANDQTPATAVLKSSGTPANYNGSVQNNAPNGNVINSVSINGNPIIYQSGNNFPMGRNGYGFFGNPNPNVPGNVNFVVNITAGVNPPTTVRVIGTNGVVYDQPFVANGNYTFALVAMGGADDLWRVELDPLA